MSYRTSQQWQEEVRRIMHLSDEELILDVAKEFSAGDALRAEVARRQTRASNRAAGWMIALTVLLVLLTVGLLALTAVLVYMAVRLPVG